MIHFIYETTNFLYLRYAYSCLAGNLAGSFDIFADGGGQKNYQTRSLPLAQADYTGTNNYCSYFPCLVWTEYLLAKINYYKIALALTCFFCEL